MAVGCFTIFFGLLRAVVRVVAAPITFAVEALGAAVFLLGPLSIYAVLFLFMPMSYSSQTVLQEIGVAADRFNSAVEPITNLVNGLFACTTDDIDSLWNKVMSFVFGVVRAILSLLDQLGVSGIPDWYQWGDRHAAAARDILHGARVRTEADRRAEIARNATLSRWDRVQHMFLPKNTRDVGTDAADLICLVTDTAFGVIGDVFDIYSTAYIGFLEFIGNFYDITSGFCVDPPNCTKAISYITLLVRWLLYFIVDEIPFLACIIDVDHLVINDPSTYFFSPAAILGCLCPAYSSTADVPGDIPLAVVGCICPLNGDTSVVTVILRCTHLQVIVDQYNTIRSTIEDIVDNGLDEIRSNVETVINFAENILKEAENAKNVINIILDAFNLDNRMARNVTIHVNSVHWNITCPKYAPPPRPVPPPSPPPEAFMDTRDVFIAKMDAKRPHARAKRLEIQARLERDWAPVLNGSMFTSFADRVGERLGPEVGARAAVMHAGIVAFLAQLPAAWKAKNIHDVTAALLTPAVVEGAAAMRDVVDAHRAVARGVSPSRRGVAQMRAAVRAFMPADRMAPLVAELRAAGEHAAADEAAAWAGRVDAYAWARALPRRAARSQKERAAEELRATQLLQREVDAAVRGNSVVIHAGASGASFILSIFSSLIYTPGALFTGFATILSAIAGFLITGLTVLLPILGQIASAFFHNIAHPHGPPQNDLFTPLTNVLYPLVANSFSGEGYTKAALESAFARVIDIAELELIWGASELIRTGLSAFAPVTGMRLGSDGLPDGNFGRWMIDRVLDAPVHEPCVQASDVEDYPCRMIDNPRVECTPEWPPLRGVCTGSNYACSVSSACNGTRCLAPGLYTTECNSTSCAGNAGRCETACFVNEDCTNGACLNRQSNQYDCLPEAPCTNCIAYAFPLRAPRNFSLPVLRAPTVYNCKDIGIDLTGTDFWNTDSFRKYNLSPELLFTWDHVRFHLTCLRLAYQGTRVLLGWIIAEWRVPRTLVFAPLVSQFLLFVPAGPIVAGSAIALGGDFAAGIVGGAQGVTSAGETLQGWPWPFPYLGDELVFIGNYTATGAEPQCLAAAVPPGGWGVLDVLVIYTAVTLLFASTLALSVVLLAWTVGLFPFRIGWAGLRLGYAATRLSRAGMLPMAHTPTYGVAPDAVGVTHCRKSLAKTHPLRHPHVHDQEVLGVHVRRLRKKKHPTAWSDALLDGITMGLRAVPHLASRGGRVEDHEWFDLLHDEHGRIRDRMVTWRD